MLGDACKTLVESHSSPTGAPQKCQDSEFQCAAGACLSFSMVCDGREDCADGSDEGGECSSSVCSPGLCDHSCYQSPAGPVSC